MPRAKDFSVVREYCGHGIGRVYHEDPQVLHYGKPGTGLELAAGMTFTIEPMINAGRRDVRLLPDGWTVVTKDQSLSAQWEHTILVTDTGYEVLTLGASGRAASLRPPRRPLERAHESARAAPADWALLGGRPPRPLHARPVLGRRVPRRCWTAATNCCKDRFLADEPVEDLVRDRARLVDIALRAAWVQPLPAGSPATLALVAVGGYGRGELHPCSDIDIMVLLPKSDSADWQPDIESFLTFLWDIGLEVGHSVRTIDDCQRESLRRHQRGDHAVRGAAAGRPRVAVRRHAPRAGARPALAVRRISSRPRCREQPERHLNATSTPPTTSSPTSRPSPGGLRDIQTIGWVAKRHFGTDTLDELVAHGFLTREELRKLQAGQSFLWKVRFGLHVLTGRREDRLLFDYQIKLAQAVRLRGRELHARGRAADAEATTARSWTSACSTRCCCSCFARRS